MKLLVLVLRGLQAGAIGPYGNRWIDTPTCDALAAGGVVFDWHFAVHPDHAGAWEAWRTGCFHFPRADGSLPDAAGRPDLLAVLAQHGVRTTLIRDAPTAAPGWTAVVAAADVPASLDAARRALDQPGQAGCLIWVELSALLPPWRVPQEFVDPYFAAPPVDLQEDDEVDEEDDEEEAPASEPEDEAEEEEPLDPIFSPARGQIEEDDDVILAMQTTYAAAVSWVDSALAELLGELPDDVAVMLTADAGQSLGEHLVVGPDSPDLHEEVVHVPLLLYGPGWRAGLRVRALTQSVDLAPTVAEFFGARLEGTHGHSLLPLLGMEERSLHEYVCMGRTAGGRTEWALRTPDEAILLSAEPGALPRLYLKPDDRCEINDVALPHLEHAEALAKTLRAFMQAAEGPGPLTPPPLPAEEEDEEESPPS